MRIDYLSGSRADFGLMLPCLLALDRTEDFDCRVVVTGQHLLPEYGGTLADIEASGLEIAGRIPVKLTGADGREMALALADELAGLTHQWTLDRPDAILLLGDRGEMVAGALAAVHLGIPVIHVAGGDRSGTLDESFRHAITKLAHVHLCSTNGSAERVARMGEARDSIHVIGAPGLVGLQVLDSRKVDFAQTYGLPDGYPVALVIFHPVVQEAQLAGRQMELIVEALREAGLAQLILRPNSDAGGALIDAVLDREAGHNDVCVVDHLARDRYLIALRDADILVGNSSSGIVEAASLRTACLNIGTRQNARERSANTHDCPEIERAALAKAIAAVRQIVPDGTNVYGAGDADELLIAALRKTRFGPEMLSKCNSY